MTVETVSAGAVALIFAALAALSAFGIFTLTPAEKDSLTVVFASATALAGLLVPYFLHQQAQASRRSRK